jgi:G3E family GTPase
MDTDLFILTGFLGVGKTTALGHIIKSSADLTGTLVIVNEAGRLGLDGKIIEKSGIPVWELNNGCICCTLQVELVELLRKLLADNPPRRILMEASGLANPQALIDNVRRLVDCFRYIKTIFIIEPQIWEIRSVFGEAFHNGLSAADLIVVNKAEELDQPQLETILGEIRTDQPLAEVLATSFGQVPLEVFFRPPGGLKNTIESQGMPVQEALAGYVSLSFQCSEVFAQEKWDMFLAGWADRLERIKGQLLLERGLFYFDWVRGRADYRTALPEPVLTSLVLIGKGFEESELEEALKKLTGTFTE